MTVESDKEIQKYDFYMCCYEEDIEYGRKITEYLENPENGTIKGFLDERDGFIGMTEFKSMEYAIEHSRFIILVLSKKSLKSSWFEFTAHAGLQHVLNEPNRSRILPLYVEDMAEKDIPLSLSIISGLSYNSNPKSNFWIKLRRTISSEVL